MDLKYNVKAIITNTSDRIIFSGYRPAHNINGYFTTGLHKYIETDTIGTGESSVGYIAFITPELYISISEGEIIGFYEGSKKIGFAKIIEVYK